MPKDALTDKIYTAAKNVVKDSLDRFPPLVTYNCLADASSQLAAATLMQLNSNEPAVSEFLTMPRRGFGPRPVEILSPTTRTLYASLVEILADSLPQESRGSQNWTEHRTFGRKGEHIYVVELDLAACYELIDHADLRRELLLRSFDHKSVSVLSELLSTLGRRGRGLPQMLRSSDRLADAYLSIIDRKLMRSGHLLHRYADDFRIIAHTWIEANEIIEEASEYARSLGLILSSAKTQVRRRKAVDEAEDEPFELLDTYLEHVEVSLSEVVSFDGPYGEVSFDLQMPDDVVALTAAYKRVLETWHLEVKGPSAETKPTNSVNALARLINTALRKLGEQDEDLDVQLLVDLVFHDPTRLEYVCRYALQRMEIAVGSTPADIVRLIDELVQMGRQGSWAKLWILHVIDLMPLVSEVSKIWVTLQLDDDHEVVRAQAAWAAATHGLLKSDHLENCYFRATELTAPALAAVAARQHKSAKAGNGKPLSDQLVKAIKDDGPLNKEAYKWGLK